MKVLQRTVLTIVTFLAVGSGLALHFYLDAIVKSAVTRLLPPLTKTSVSIGSVRLSPFSGKGNLRDIVIGNPTGFHTPHAAKIGRVSVDIDLRSIPSNTVVVRSIRIEAPEIYYETTFAGSNIARIQQNIEATVPAPKPQNKDRGKTSKQKKIVIDDVLVSGGKIYLAAQMLHGTSLPIPLPEIHLQGIGRKSNGATIQEAASQVIGALTRSVTRAGGGLQSVGQNVKKIGENVGKALKSLFRGKK